MLLQECSPVRIRASSTAVVQGGEIGPRDEFSCRQRQSWWRCQWKRQRQEVARATGSRVLSTGASRSGPTSGIDMCSVSVVLVSLFICVILGFAGVRSRSRGEAAGASRRHVGLCHCVSASCGSVRAESFFWYRGLVIRFLVDAGLHSSGLWRVCQVLFRSWQRVPRHGEIPASVC